MGVRYYSGDPVQRQQEIENRWATILSQAADPYSGAQARAVSDYRANWPHMRAGEIMPLAQAGVPPHDSLARLVAEKSAFRRKQTSGVWDPARALTRWASAAVAAPLELAQAGLRDVVTALPGQSGEVVGGAATGAAVGSIIPGLGTAIGAGVGAGVGALAGLFAPEVKGTPQNPFSQTTLGQAFAGKDMGQGFFAGGAAREAQAEVSTRAANIDGYAVTPGRLVTSAVAEPGSTPFNLMSGLVDAGIAMSKLDPTAAGLKGLTKARKAGIIGAGTDFVAMGERQAAGDLNYLLGRKAAGLAEGPRKDLIPEVAREWLTASKPGKNVVEALRRETSFEAIREVMPQVDVATQLRLTDAQTTEDILVALDPHLGGSIMGSPFKATRIGDPALGYGITRKTAGDSRLMSAMPSGELNLNRPSDALEEFNRLQLNIQVPGEVRSANTRAMAEALVSDAPDAKLRAKQIFAETLFTGDAGVLAKVGTEPVKRQRFLRQLMTQESEQLRYFTEGEALQTVPHGTLLYGQETPLAIASIFAGEADVIRMSRATVRDMRRASSKFKNLLTSESWDTFTTGADAVMGLWRPFVLLRGAWTVRVIAEEQVRMAAAGLNSAFAHPFSFIALAASDDGRLANTLNRFGAPGEALAGKLGRAAGGATGEFTEAPVEAQAILRGELNEYLDGVGRRQQNAGWVGREGADPRRNRYIAEKTQTTYRKAPTGEADVGYWDALHEQLEILNRNPIARRLANGGTFAEDGAVVGTGRDQVMSWFTQGSGKELHTRLLQEPGGAHLRTGAGVNGLLDSTAAEVERLSGARASSQEALSLTEMNSNPALKQAIATGELDGVPMRLRDGSSNPEFTKALQRYADVAPEGVVGSTFRRRTFKERYDDFTAKWFDTLMGRPSAKMSRSPTFRQQYWRKMEDLMLTATKEDQTKILSAAKKWKLSGEQVGRLEKRMGLSYGSHTLDEVDLLAKRDALNFTKDLLYDSANRGQLSDALRLVFPFLEAQKEVMTRWAKLGTEAPQVFRRLQQTVDGARGSGFFYKDEQTGEEMFAYPGSHFLTEKFLGLGAGGAVPIKLGGRVQGLSMFGSGLLPGVGPAIQVPAGWLLGDRPEYDQIRELINPMGTEAEPAKPSDVVGSALGAFIPGWAKNVLTGVISNEDDRAYGNMVIDIFRSGVSSGKWSMDSPEEVERGMHAAKHLASRLFLFRGLASLGGAPTSVTPEYMAQDKDGKWLMADIVRQDYRKMLDGEAKDLDGNPIDPDDASEAFMEKYGENALLYMQSYTEATTAAPTTDQASDWIRSNPGAVKKHQSVYGFFAPQEDNEFDYQAYLRQFKSGERVSLTPDQFVDRAQNRVGAMVYYNVKDKYGPYPTAPQREYLTRLREGIRGVLPGFDKHLPLPEKYDTQTLVRDLRTAVSSGDFADRPVQEALEAYFAIHDLATQSAQAAGLKTFTTAKGTRVLRDWVRNMGETLAREVPDFQAVWDRVLSREMMDDGQYAEGPAAEAVLS